MTDVGNSIRQLAAAVQALADRPVVHVVPNGAAWIVTGDPERVDAVKDAIETVAQRAAGEVALSRERQSGARVTRVGLSNQLVKKAFESANVMLAAYDDAVRRGLIAESDPADETIIQAAKQLHRDLWNAGWR